jgi:hypothetical protein
VPRACSRSTACRSHCALYIHHALCVVALGEAKLPERVFKRHVLAGQHQSSDAGSETAAASYRSIRSEAFNVWRHGPVSVVPPDLVNTALSVTSLSAPDYRGMELWR